MDTNGLRMWSTRSLGHKAGGFFFLRRPHCFPFRCHSFVLSSGCRGYEVVYHFPRFLLCAFCLALFWNFFGHCATWVAARVVTTVDRRLCVCVSYVIFHLLLLPGKVHPLFARLVRFFTRQMRPRAFVSPRCRPMTARAWLHRHRAFPLVL